MRGLPNINRIACAQCRGHDSVKLILALAALRAAWSGCRDAGFRPGRFRSCLSGLRSQAAGQGHFRPGLRCRDARHPAGSEDPRAHEQPAGVQDGDLGLSRGPGRRAAGRRTGTPPCSNGASALAAAESALRRRSPRDRRRLGRRVRFRQEFRRSGPWCSRSPPCPATRRRRRPIFAGELMATLEDRPGRRHRSARL